MLFAIRRLALSLILILTLSAFLLLSDIANRSAKKSLQRAAIFKITSNSAMDQTVDGIIIGLSERGYIDGQTIVIKQFNAEGDLSMANIISQEIINQKYDIAITSSTPAMQVFANANKKGTVTHIFGAVTDPYSSGIGLEDTSKPLKHPPHLAGIGSFQPVEDAIRLALMLFPDLKIVGTVWNSGERNSELCVIKAREVCKKLGIEFKEVTVENTTGVPEASQAVVSMGVQAIWVGGDNAVDVSIDHVIKSANSAKIPVFSNYPDHAKKGALFGIGANQIQVGRLVGLMAADVLGGKSTASIEVKNIVPEKLYIDKTALTGLKDNWNIPQQVLSDADSIFYK